MPDENRCDDTPKTGQGARHGNVLELAGLRSLETRGGWVRGRWALRKIREWCRATWRRCRGTVWPILAVSRTKAKDGGEQSLTRRALFHHCERCIYHTV